MESWGILLLKMFPAFEGRKVICVSFGIVEVIKMGKLSWIAMALSGGNLKWLFF